ncbi:hypothetical protein RV134_350252 [Roseovarius sp. EC-HK134]|nr:hypothetical protein RV420_400533 [Roseovarius sp. EC-SD190]VVT28919.1 hypothetical protein RV134_350252 [Roseovarius sp. EC-HK134]
MSTIFLVCANRLAQVPNIKSRVYFSAPPKPYKPPSQTLHAPHTTAPYPGRSSPHGCDFWR